MSVGESTERFDARGKVTGVFRYSGDAVPAGALHAVTVFSGQPHARMTRMDISAAEDAPGVVTIVTAADVPVNEYGLTMFDQPVLLGLEHTGRSAVDPTISRWEADQVAVVVAETSEQARDAATLIEIDWEPLPIVENIEQARGDDVLVHGELPSNNYHHLKIRKGDMAAGWDAADIVVESTYELPHQEHAYLQTESGAAWVGPDDVVVIETGGQWAWEDQQQVAHALDVDPDEVRVMYAAIGGAFGGKEDMSLQCSAPDGRSQASGPCGLRVRARSGDSCPPCHRTPRRSSHR